MCTKGPLVTQRFLEKRHQMKHKNDPRKCGWGLRLLRASPGCSWLVVMMCCSIWRSRERPSSCRESLLSPGDGVRFQNTHTLVITLVLDFTWFALKLDWRLTHQDLQPCGLHLRGQYGDHADGGVGHGGQQQHRRNRWASEHVDVFSLSSGHRKPFAVSH